MENIFGIDDYELTEEEKQRLLEHNDSFDLDDHESQKQEAKEPQPGLVESDFEEENDEPSFLKQIKENNKIYDGITKGYNTNNKIIKKINQWSRQPQKEPNGEDEGHQKGEENVDELNKSRTSFCSNLSGFMELDENFREELLDMRKNKFTDIFPKGLEETFKKEKLSEPEHEKEEESERERKEELKGEGEPRREVEGEPERKTQEISLERREELPSVVNGKDEKQRKKTMEKLREMEKKEERMREDRERLFMLREDARSMLVEEQFRRETREKELKRKKETISESYSVQKKEVFKEIEKKEKEREAQERRLMAKEEEISRDFEINQREFEKRQQNSLRIILKRQKMVQPHVSLLDQKGQELQRRLNSREGPIENKEGHRGASGTIGMLGRRESEAYWNGGAGMRGKNGKLGHSDENKENGDSVVFLKWSSKEGKNNKKTVQDVLSSKIMELMKEQIERVARILKSLRPETSKRSLKGSSNHSSFSIQEAFLAGFHNSQGFIKPVDPISEAHRLMDPSINDADDIFGSNELSDPSVLDGINESKAVPLSQVLKPNPKIAKEARESQLVKIDLRMKGISKIDSSISLLEGASIVSLAMNQISEIGDQDASKMKNSSQLPLPPLKSCSSIICLDLSNNKITNYSCLSGLSNLRSLNLQLNLVTKLLPLPSLSLRALNLSNNKLSSLESLPSMPEYHSLTKLNLYRNQITSLGDALSSLSLLEDLDLGRNELKSLKGVENCVSLTRLIVYFNKLEEIADSNSSLSLLFLKEFIASSNSIKRLPSLLMPCLKELDLSDNQIGEEAPFGRVFYWPSLKTMKIGNNKLSPSGIAEILKFSIGLQEVYCAQNSREEDQSLVSLIISRCCPEISKSDILLIKEKEIKKKGFLGQSSELLKEKVGEFVKLVEFWEGIRRSSNGVFRKMPPVCWREVAKDKEVIEEFWNKKNIVFCEEWLSGKTPHSNWSSSKLIIEKKIRDRHWTRSFEKIKRFLKAIVTKKRMRKAHFDSKIKEIIRIQKNWKGFSLRKKINAKEILRKMKNADLERKRNRASCLIQKVWKGFSIREKIRKIKDAARSSKEDIFGEDNEDLDFFNQDIEIKAPKLTIPDEYAELMRAFMSGDNLQKPKRKRGVNVNNFLAHEPIHEANEEESDEERRKEAKRDSEETQEEEEKVQRERERGSLHDVQRGFPNSSSFKSGVKSKTVELNRPKFGNSSNVQDETESEPSSDQRAQSYTGEGGNGDTHSRLLKDSKYSEGMDRNKTKKFSIKTTKAPLGPSPGLMKQTKEIVETWGFKDEAVKQALQSKLIKDARRKKKKEVLTADQRFAKFVRISSKTQHQSSSISVSSGKDSRIGRIEEDF